MFSLEAAEYFYFLVCFLYFLYLIGFLKLIHYKNLSSTLHFTTKVSILICAKNEAYNLKQNLPFILNQSEVDFEVIAVNDQSSDATLSVLEGFSEQYENVKVFTNKGKSSKKKALALAKQKASGDYFVLTDADCRPASKFWLKQMVSNLKNQHEVVLGYAPHAYKSGFLNSLQRFETLTTALQYLSAALYKIPYMGVGRNMAYTKTIDQKILFHTKELDLLSGDDDLWIQKARKYTHIQIQINPESFVFSDAESSFTSWWNQKRRHVSAAHLYALQDQLALSFIYIMKFFFWFGFFMLVFFSKNIYIWMGFIFILISIFLVYKSATKRFREKNIAYFSPVLDFCLICFQLSLFISNLVSPITKWK